jgi:hypothetical protein
MKLSFMRTLYNARTISIRFISATVTIEKAKLLGGGGGGSVLSHTCGDLYRLKVSKYIMEQPVVVTADITFSSPLVLSLPAACFLLLGMLLLSAATT